MNINIERPDIEIAVKTLMEAILTPFKPDQKQEVLQWAIEILVEIQNTVE